MTKLGSGDGGFSWQQAAMDQQLEESKVPGHLNININMNVDYTPTDGGDVSSLIDALRGLLEK